MQCFNSEQELFQKWFEERYNLCIDPHCNHWQEINHPEVSLLNEEASLLDIDPSGSTAEVTTEGKDFEFELNSPSQGAIPDTKAPNSTSNSSRKSSPTLLCSSSSHSTSLSKFLDDTALSTPKVSPASSRQPRAKLLTSMSSIVMLEDKEKKAASIGGKGEKQEREREEKKRKKKEELEKRAKEKYEKKKQRDEEKKRKAEEKEQRIKEKGKAKLQPKSIKYQLSTSTTRAGAERRSNPSFDTLNSIKRSTSKCHEIDPNIG